MQRGGDGFFRAGQRRDVGGLTDRVFEVAWFWKLDPADVLRLPLSRFDLYERQAERISEQVTRE